MSGINMKHEMIEVFRRAFKTLKLKFSSKALGKFRYLPYKFVLTERIKLIRNAKYFILIYFSSICYQKS